jgi:nicotinate-nucleotide--dimethylbenzimidazole phosphoribosyltransferase
MALPAFASTWCKSGGNASLSKIAVVLTMDAIAVVWIVLARYAGGNSMMDVAMTSGLPFDDIRELVARLPDADGPAQAGTRAIFERAGAQQGRLGRLEDIAVWLSAWSGRVPPAVRRPLVAIFAGNHGIAATTGVAETAAGATAEAVELYAAGGGAINQVCIAHDLGLKVFDLALHIPTGDITMEAALDERGCAATIAFGMEAIAGGTDLLCVGDLGTGNSTVAAALLAAVLGGEASGWVAPSADPAVAARRVEAVNAALACHGGHLSDPLEALRRVGGREFAALAGAIVAARMQKIPVLLDGLPALATAAVLKAANAAALDHCLLASRPAGPAGRKAAEALGLTPLLEFDMEQAGGIGAALAAGLVKAAALTASGLAEAQRRS